MFRHLWRFIRSCKSNTERPWYSPSASLTTASYVTDKRHQNQTPTWLQGSEPQVSQGSKPRTRASKVSLSQVWRRRQDTLSQAPIPVIPTTMAILTVSPATAFLSITVTLTPGNELTFGLFILKQHLMVVHINQLYHVQPLNQNPQDLTLLPTFYFSWHLLFPDTGKMGSDAKCL